MASKNPTTKFKADISELKSQFQEAQRTIRLANAQFKSATGGMDNWAKSADGLTAKMEQLNTVVDGEKKKLSSLEEQYKLVCKEQGEASSGAQNLLIKINNQKAAVERCEKQIEKYQQKLTQSKSASEKLNTTIETQETELKKLKDKYADVVLEQGKNSDSAKALKDEIGKLSDDLQTNKSKMQNAKDAAEKLDKAFDDSSKEGGGISAYQVALGNLISQGISKAISGLKDAAKSTYDTWREVDAGQDAMIKKTGATGAEAEKLNKVYNDVTSSITGDYTDMGNAIGEINTRFGFTDKKLKDSTIAFMKFAKLNDTDVVSSIQLVARAMGDAGIDVNKYADVLDILTLAGQKTGIGVDTLAENLTKYGAPMRALGFDLEESIALFSQWEKAGVNTEIAFSGMKKAIGTWGKEGKDSRTEFKKTLEEIKNCPDIAAATTKAIEVFGQKAGPDLADAIQGGRFNYQNLLDDMKKSKGTINDTYDEIEDSADRIQLTVQKVKTQIGNTVGEFVKKHEPQIEKAIKTILGKGKELLKWVSKNKQPLLTTLKVVTGAVAGIFAINKVSTFIGSIKTLIGVLSGLNMSNPLGWLTVASGAVVGAVSGLVKLVQEIDDSPPEPDYSKLTEEQQKIVDKNHEIRDSYNEWRDERDKLTNNVTTEFGYYDSLWQELQDITGEQGNIKKGYEDRATYIANELGKVTGTEITIVGGVIKQYEKLKKSIDEALLAKKAEAMQGAYIDSYSEAILNKDEALKSYNDLSKEIPAQEKLVKKLEEKAEKQYAEDKAKGNKFADYNYLINSSDAEDARKKLNSLKKEAETAQNTYIGYITTISNYENLSAAILSEDKAKIEDALVKMQYSFQTAKTGTVQTLAEQTEAYKTELANMKQAIKDGMPGVTQEQVNQMQNLVNQSEAELKKLQPKAKHQGVKGSVAFIRGVDSQKPKLVAKVEELVEAGVIELSNADTRKSADDFVSGFTNRLEELSPTLGRFMKKIGQYTITGSFNEGLDEHSPSRASAESANNYILGFINEIKEKTQSVKKLMGSLALSIIKSFNEQLGNEQYDLSGMSNAIRGRGGHQANGYGGTSIVKNTTYNQTINSPTALDSLTIYRQSRNLFSYKGGR